MDNLFTNLPRALSGELVEVLVRSPAVRVERIISTGHQTPEGSWYDQDEHEWVCVLQGEAELLFEGDAAPVRMKAGDHVLIPAHRKHRVHRTDETRTTVWLAVFFSGADPVGD